MGKRKFKDRKGFTITEMIVAMLVLVVVLGVIYLVFSYSTKSYQATTSQIDTQSQFRMALDYIRNDVGDAYVIELIDKEDIDAYGGNPSGMYIYAEIAANGKGYMCKEDQNGNVSYYDNLYQLPNFYLGFTSSTDARQLNVIFNTDSTEIIGNVLIENTAINNIVGEYTALYFEPY